MENIEREYTHQTMETQLIQSECEQPNSPLINRASASLGNLLIRLGTRLKARAHSRLTTEEGSPPSFIIVL